MNQEQQCAVAVCQEARNRAACILNAAISEAPTMAEPAVVEDMRRLAYSLFQKTASEPVARQCEPVAVIGNGWAFLWASGDPIADIVARHGLKIGTKLYADPASQATSGAAGDAVCEDAEIFAHDEWIKREYADDPYGATSIDGWIARAALAAPPAQQADKAAAQQGGVRQAACCVIQCPMCSDLDPDAACRVCSVIPPEDVSEWELAVRVASPVARTGMVPVKARTLLAVNAVLANAVAAQATPQPSQQARQPMSEDEVWVAAYKALRLGEYPVLKDAVPVGAELIPFCVQVARGIEAHHRIASPQAEKEGE